MDRETGDSEKIIKIKINKARRGKEWRKEEETVYECYRMS